MQKREIFTQKCAHQPEPAWLLRQRKVVGHCHCWHHMASCNKRENGKHYHSPAVTNSPSLSQWTKLRTNHPKPDCQHHSIPSQLLVAPVVHAHCQVRHYLVGLGWARLGSVLLSCVYHLDHFLPRERGTKWCRFRCVVLVP